MTRGRGYAPRGGYRGSRGSSWGGSRGYGSSPRGRFTSSPFTSSPYESRKYSGSSERYPPSRHSDDYRRPYRPDSGYSGRDMRSPDRKRSRPEAPSSRHDSYGGYGSSSRYESSYDRRSSPPPPPRRSGEFRRPSGPPPPRMGAGYRGRISSRGSRSMMKFRERPMRRRLVESSYAIRRRVPLRSQDIFARRVKINKLRSAIARRAKKRDEEDEKSDGEKESDEEKEKTADEMTESKDESIRKSVKEGDDSKEDKKSEDGEEKTRKKTFIKLHCPHCGMKCLTFRKYDMHLTSRNHLMSMRKVALKQKSILQQMRAAQRNAQNELEKSVDADDLAARTSFCPICKLNYKQKKAVHQASESHKNMKKFLMPYCKVCNITFKSPMMYENHSCSIEHMKRKQRFENGSADSAEEDNLENFTTIDSVGDNDDEEEAASKDEPKINVGIEQIQKIEVYYCDLCKMYLQRVEESEMSKVLSKHCKHRVHMKAYVRFKERQELREKAEKLQRKETAEKQEKEKAKDESQDGEKTGVKEEDGKEDEEARDDKMWADVDKDLGEIIAEAEGGGKSSDEDEEDSHANAERYDRFKYSEKNGDEKTKKKADEGATNNEEVKASEVKEEK